MKCNISILLFLSSLTSRWWLELIPAHTVYSHALTVFVFLGFLSPQPAFSLLIVHSLCVSLPSVHPVQQSCQPGMFQCVCACVRVCRYVCVNETDKSILATPPTLNQTWQTNKICMLSNCHILPAVAFCRNSSKTNRLTTSVFLHTYNIWFSLEWVVYLLQGHHLFACYGSFILFCFLFVYFVPFHTLVWILSQSNDL